MSKNEHAAHILLVEDDRRLAKLTAEYLEKNGFSVGLEERGDTAPERILREQPDLLILDIMLPGMDGFDICRQVRSGFRGAILMLTAKDEDMDQIIGLELGADDYLAKPVPPRVLLARVKALIRRVNSKPENFTETELHFGIFYISATARVARLRDKEIELSSSEFDLLWLLAQNAGQILSRDDLLQKLRGIDFDGLDRSIDARVSRLRKKIDDDPEHPVRIKTVRSKGYLFSLHDWH